mmetsp:Transcript_27872/g.57066  ORF Transcript_27872/g.57066 Transcript_27872/m.57066 type:complete len:179 (-) Transcript_27872:390-926(-)
MAEVWNRSKWLAFLMLLQSVSTTFLAAFEDIIRAQPVIAMFMMMLVGVGGNSGGQAVARAIQLITLNGYVPGNGIFRRQLEKELSVAVWLSLTLAWFACAMVWIGQGGSSNAIAIAFSTGFIILVSVLAGTSLPYGLHRAGIDVVHSAAFIQVAMDVWGIVTTCFFVSLLLPKKVWGV